MALAMATVTEAQNSIIPDATLGAGESSIVDSIGGQFDIITGGAVREQNLFHSFAEFSVGEESGAIFLVEGDAISNILARVTGTTISEINGFIATVQSNNGDVGSTDANLFLLNPNGIVFGENAFISVDGSFYATTAEAIELEDQIFSATNPAQSVLLAIDPSTVFTNYLTENSGNIENRSLLVSPEDLTLAANQITLQDSSTTAENNLTLQAINDLSIINSRVRLRDSAGDLLLQGSDITIVDSTVEVPGLGGLNNNLTLQATNNISALNSIVALFNSTGELLVQGGNISITDSLLNTLGQSSLGDITIVADGQVEILSRQGSAGISSFVEGPGAQSSNISITADSLRAINRPTPANNTGALISTFANNSGSSGNIDIDVVNDIVLDGIGLTTFVGGNTTGNAGSIQIDTTDLELLNGSQIQSDVTFISNNPNTASTGNIIINATGNLRLAGFRQINGVNVPSFITTSVSNLDNGTAGDLTISANVIESDDRGFFSTSTSGSGSAGNVTIQANQLAFRNGANISSTSAEGVGGDIVLNIADTASLDGTAAFPLTTRPDGLPVNFPGAVGDGSSVVVTTGLITRVFGGGSGGDIRLRANNLEVTNGATISASTRGAGNAGTITLDVADTVRVDGRNPSGLVPSFIDTDAEQTATGSGGDLRITANRLEVTGGAQLSSSLSGTGRAGDIFLDADTILVQGPDVNAVASRTEEPRSGIVSNIQETGRGIAGDIVVTANNLIMIDGGAIDASVLGSGAGGDIIVNVTDLVRIAGVAADGLFSGIGSNNEALDVGTAGNIFLQAGRLEILDGASISSSTFQTGEAGNITLDIAGTARLEGVNPILPERPSGVFSRTEGDSDGGNLRILAEDLEILDGAVLNTRSLTAGRSGNIVVSLGGQLRAVDGEITTASSETSGGSIDISAQAIRLSGDSDIRTDVELGEGRGGNITLRANAILLFDDSDILAFSATGEGGNILLDTPVFFGENFQLADQLRTRQELAALDGNNRVDVNATGRVASGNIGLPDLENIASSLTELPSNLVDSEALIAGSCVAHSSSTGGSLVIGDDGLSQQPGESNTSFYATGDVQTIGAAVKSPQEPQGLYPLADGRLVLSQEC
ncbi:MAG: filamentous hemagglutinin N-terminal domain-containing protein [Cyanobacteria bacterium P01_D01_bin.56]